MNGKYRTRFHLMFNKMFKKKNNFVRCELFGLKLIDFNYMRHSWEIWSDD